MQIYRLATESGLFITIIHQRPIDFLKNLPGIPADLSHSAKTQNTIDKNQDAELATIGPDHNKISPQINFRAVGIIERQRMKIDNRSGISRLFEQILILRQDILCDHGGENSFLPRFFLFQNLKVQRHLTC